MLRTLRRYALSAGGVPELADVATAQDLADLKRFARILQDDNPQRFPTEEEAKKGMDETRPFDLPNEPQTWELREALGGTRAEAGIALDSVASVLEDVLEEIARLKMHRHDTTKTYSGRPEM